MRERNLAALNRDESNNHLMKCYEILSLVGISKDTQFLSSFYFIRNFNKNLLNNYVSFFIFTVPYIVTLY